MSFPEHVLRDKPWNKGKLVGAHLFARPVEPKFLCERNEV
jgi:hypothetical protein